MSSPFLRPPTIAPSLYVACMWVFYNTVLTKVHSSYHASLFMWHILQAWVKAWCTRIQNYIIIWKFHCPNIALHATCPPVHPFLSSPELLATRSPFAISLAWPFPEDHRVGITQEVAFSDWFLSHTPLRFLCVFYRLIAFILMGKKHRLFIHFPTGEHLGCILVLKIINKAAKIFMYRFLCGYTFSSYLGKY